MITALWKRYERLIRFLFVGGAVTLLYSAVTIALTDSHIASNRVWAALIASLLVIPLSFLAHRRVTYKDTAHAPQQWLRFGVLGGLNLLVNIGLMRLSELASVSLWVALVIGWFVVPAVNFTVNTIWVFQAKRFAGLEP